MDFGSKRILCNLVSSLVFIITAFGPLVDAECTSGVELLVDSKTWPSSDIPLYKPLWSNGVFVRCLRCSDRGRPSWYNSNDENIPFCGDKISYLLCVDYVRNRIQDLKFLNFTQSQVGRYTCKLSNDMSSIMINALSLHPINQLTSNKMATKPLNCETTGNESVTYHWETSNINGGQWMNISNSNSSILVVGTLEQSQQYRCVVSNEAGSTRSNVANITVLKIITHPQDIVVTLNLRVRLVCTSSVSSNVVFSWTHNGTDIDGQSTADDTSTLTISSVQYSNAGTYVCTLRSGSISVKSNTATLTVYGPPTIMIHPNDKVIAVNMSVTLNCKGTGKGPMTYQWESKTIDGRRWMNVRNRNNQNLVVMNLQQSQQYRCVVSNEAGSTRSNVATVTVLKIITHPQSKFLPVDFTLNLMCISSLSSNVMFSWTHNGTSISGSSTAGDTSTLTTSRVQYDDAGSYVCTVRSGSVSVMSNTATVTVYGPPIIMTHPSNQLITMSMSVTLNCQGAGDGSIAYQWESRRVSGGRWVNISNTNTKTLFIKILERSRQYRCVVSNEAGSTRSNVATVTVLSFSNQPTNHTVTALGDVTFQCTTSVNGARYSWHRVNGMIPSRSVGQRSSTLTISRAIPPDEGMYYCIISKNTVAVESHRVTLEVNDLLSIIVTLTNDIVGEGGMARFIATASGINMNFLYQWKKRGKNNLPNKVSGADGTVLTIPNVVKSDEGQYYCIVTNEWGRSVESDNVSLTVKAGLLIFWRHPVDQIINNSQAVTFESFVNGSKSVSLVWEKDGREYRTRNRDWVKYESNGGSNKLIFSSATVNDGGKYRCRATNGHGNSILSNEAELIIRPQIIINPNSTIVLIGQSAQLLCEALGTNLVYQWMKDSVIISGANSRILIIDTTDQADEGVYKCVAKNSGGMAESNPATITVYDSPVIEELPQQLHIVLGEQLEIRCTATNDQDAPNNLMFSWKTPNNVSFSNKTTNEVNISHKATSTLLINTVTHDHGGVYQCIVRNGEPLSANSSKATTLIVEVQSSPPLRFSIFHIDVTLLQLTWREPENPNGRIDYYRVYYSNKSHSLSKQIANDGNYNDTYTLGNLRPYTEYNVYVTAVRLIGGDASRPLEGVKSRMVTGKTLAGVPVIDHRNKSRIILNSEISTFDETFTIDLPAVTLQHGLFSYLYIIVLTDNMITNTESISTAMLLEESLKSHPLYYVAAVVNVSQYLLGKGLSYILGGGDNTTDINNKVFYNRKIENGYYYFFRIFSFDTTPENELYITTELQKIEIPQLGGPVENTSNQDNTESNNASVMAIAILAVLLAISLICVIVLTMLLFKSKMKPPASDTGKSVQPPEPTYEMVVKHDDVKLEKNPAYSVQDTSMNHNYDFIPESNQAKAEQ